MSTKKVDLPHVSIVILNYNGWKYTTECLESLYQMKYPNYDVILTDNGSTNDSIEKIKEYCQGNIKVASKFFKYDSSNKPINILEYEKEDLDNEIYSEKEEKFSTLASNKKIRLIKIKKNMKYSPGVNIPLNYIIKKMKTDYVLLLNNDTVIESNVLNELVKFLERFKKVGIVGPNICFYNKPHKAQLPDLQDVKAPIEVDYVNGATFLFKFELLKIIGIFDPIYLFFFEEKDYCYRARNAGYKIIYLPTISKVFHKVGGDTKPSGTRLYYLTRSQFIFNKKHKSALESLGYFIRYFIPNIIYELFTHPKQLKIVIKGARDGILV